MTKTDQAKIKVTCWWDFLTQLIPSKPPGFTTGQTALLCEPKVDLSRSYTYIYTHIYIYK